MTKKKKRKGGKSITRTAFKWIRVAALVGPAAVDIIQQPDLEHKAGYVLKHYTGYDVWQRTFNFSDLVAGWSPYIAASLVTHGIPKLISIIRRL